jgi:DNA-binding beta-propeller fold protein YncE
MENIDKPASDQIAISRGGRMKISRLRTALIGGAFAIAIGATPNASAQEATIQTGPRLDFPAGVATDGVAVYVANSRNNTIDKIDLTAHSISLVAGTMFKEGSNDGTGATAMFTSPSGVAIAGGNLLVSDTNNSTIRQVTLPGGVVTTVAGTTNIPGTDDGKGANAHFNLPTQIAVDPNGSRFFVTDTNNSLVRVVTIGDWDVKTIAGQPQTDGKVDGPPSKSAFNRPRGIATDGKVVYVSDTGNDVIRKIDLSNMTTSTFAGTGEEGDKDGGPTEAQFNNPGAMATDGANIYVLDADNHAVRKIDAATGTVSKVTLVNGHIGSGCALSKDGKILYFSDTTQNAVQQVDVSNGNVAAVYPLQ